MGKQARPSLKKIWGLEWLQLTVLRYCSMHDPLLSQYRTCLYDVHLFGQGSANEPPVRPQEKSRGYIAQNRASALILIARFTQKHRTVIFAL